MTGFIEEPSREDTILVIVSYSSESKCQLRMVYSDAVLLAKTETTYALGTHCGIGYYRVGNRLVSIDHSKVEQVEYHPRDPDAFMEAVKKTKVKKK